MSYLSLRKMVVRHSIWFISVLLVSSPVLADDASDARIAAMQKQIDELTAKLAVLESRVGGQARTFSVGHRGNNSLVIQSAGASVVLANKGVEIRADRILLSGKEISLGASNRLNLNAPVINLLGDTINSKPSANTVIKGSTILGN